MPVADAIRAGRAVVELFADDSKLVSGLRRAQATLNAFGHDLLRMGLFIQGFGVALATPFALSAKIFAETGDRLDAMSKRTGIAVESLSQLELATQLTDFSMKGMENALKRMQRTIVQMSTGTAQASRALGFLHLNSAEIVHLKPEDQLGVIADRLAAMSDKTERAGAAMAIFGREATGLLPMLLQGSKGLEKYKRRADQLGLTIEGKVVAAADHLNDVIEVIKLQVNRLAIAIGGALEPALKELAERVVRTLANVIKWAKANSELIRTVAKAALAVIGMGSAVFSLGIAFLIAGKAIGVILRPLAALKTLISVVSSVVFKLGAILLVVLGSPLITSIALIAALSLAILIWTGDVRKAVDWVSKKFRTLGTVMAGTLQGITDAVLAGDLTAAWMVFWLGAKLAALGGVGALEKIWGEFSTFFISLGVDTLSRFEAIWLDMGAFIAEVWTALWANVMNKWDAFVFNFKVAALDLGGFVKDIADSIAVAFIPKENREEVLKQMRQETIDIKITKQGDLAKNFLERSGASAEQLTADLREITRKYEASMARIGDANLGTNQMLQDELDAGLSQTRAELVTATKEWEKAVADAAAARKIAEEEDLGIGDIGSGVIPNLTDRVDSTKERTIEVAGTFTNAALLGRADGGSAAERTARATERSVALLEDIEENTEDGGTFD